MKESLNKELILAINDRILEEKNIVLFLKETLHISDMAAYRRLRGEVPFSYYEAALITKALGLSLDKIAGNAISDGAMFTYNLEHSKDPMTYFYIIFKRYCEIFYYLSCDPKSTASTATNFIPFTFYFQYQHLSKFMLCRWLHQNQKIKAMGSMSMVNIPDNVKDIFLKMGEFLLRIATTNIILDQNVFLSMKTAIQYYAELKLISKEDISILKQELLDLLDCMEEAAITGQLSNGNTVNIYLANISFESSYSFLEKPDFFISLFHVFVIDYISSHHPEIAKMQKEWIQSLKRYSMLISQCGEKQRIEFFKKQRQLIRSI